MMTREEMLALVESMIQAEEAHSPPGQSGWVLGQLKKLYAALKAEKPLAEGWLYAISRTIPEGTIYGATFSAYNPDWADQQRIIILEEAAR